MESARYKYKGLPGKDSELARVRAQLPTDAHYDQQVRDKILKEDEQARKASKDKHKMSNFRIEVQFGSKRTSRGTTVAKIRVWQSAQNLIGDGDVSMVWCGRPGCLVPFSAEDLGELVTCPYCYGTFPREEISSELLFKRPMEEILQLVAQFFYQLKGDADIIVRWIKVDVRNLNNDSAQEEEWARVEEDQWEQVVYPYWRILEDTMHGQSLINRLRDLMG